VPADERPDQGAWLSGDGTYRYTLFRRWGQLFAEDAKPLVWVMLNPSTANADLDDQTVRKVRGFTVRAGYSWLCIVNLFAYRTGSPTILREYVTEHLLPAQLWCVGTTHRGDPRHPCYAPYSELLPWPLTAPAATPAPTPPAAP
jgi:hypothetical protein